MAELVRTYAPESKIVLGGHGTKIDGVEELIRHDFICKGEGVFWFRRLLGENLDRPLKHPSLYSALSKRVFGVPLKIDAGVLLPGIGCPNACRFCATSHFFDKKYTPYFDTGKELFDICLQQENDLNVQEFFVMDENFLKRPERANELMKLMEQHHKYYRFGIFSSAETIAQVGVEFLARLGVYFVWIGVESKFEIYAKNQGLDLKTMIRNLRDHGITVLTSGILFLEQHDRDTIWDDIRHLVGLQSDYVQFMQLGPLPGTQLYHDYDRQGLLRKDIPYEEWHGQHQIWFNHPNFSQAESERIIKEAFIYDLEQQGASLLRMCDTALRGYMGLARYSDPYMQQRREVVKANAQHLRPALAILKKYAPNSAIRQLTEDIMARYDAAFGPLTLRQRGMAWLCYGFAALETRRLAAGKHRYQPRTVATKYRMSIRELARQRLEEEKNRAGLLALELPPALNAVHNKTAQLRGES
jgi:haloalkane dehalogenase